MRSFIFFLLFTFSMNAQDLGMAQHCGYDFTSYLVLNVHEEGTKENIKGLQLTLVDLEGNEVINTNSKYSWNHADKTLVFSFNYLIDQDNQPLQEAMPGIKERWFFPYAKDNYFLSVVNGLEVDKLKVKIEDVDGAQNGGFFESQVIELNYFDLFVLCSNQANDYAVQFGRKANKPLEVIIKKAQQ
jgi:hypothetical protein